MYRTTHFEYLTILILGAEEFRISTSSSESDESTRTIGSAGAGVVQRLRLIDSLSDSSSLLIVITSRGRLQACCLLDDELKEEIEG